ncbi:SAM-dependent methyltransferase [Streptomyces sp. NPDC051567]|uniref:SAM-dependent methyltransferase n=1 Tax=Streptomyces sp. NPDC051567 TaxID=3365660 RepID=UPI003798F59B
MSTDQAVPTVEDTNNYYEIANQLVVELWDENFHMGYWHSEEDDSSNRVAADRMTDLVIERSGLGGGGRMLDIGCGIGLPAFRAAAVTPAEIVGVSNNMAQIDEAGRRSAELGLADRVTFAYADALALPYADDSFDVVWSFETLPHLDRPAAYAEMLRVLRPGGRVVVTDHLLAAPLTGKHKEMVDRFTEEMQATPRLPLDEHRRLILDAGFELDELTDISLHTGRTAVRVTEAVDRRFDELVGRYGEGIAPMLEVFRAPVGVLPEMGYLIAVARKAA